MIALPWKGWRPLGDDRPRQADVRVVVATKPGLHKFARRLAREAR